MYQIAYLISLGCLLRWLVGYYPYSGQSKPPMYGDYEAQRHWMEITTSLPATDWYKNSTDNDLNYWGLDYPPLTAYHMQALGFISKNINSSWVELHSSRGHESQEHKLFMRLSVLIVDLLIYTAAVVYYFYIANPTKSFKDNILPRALATGLVIYYPGQILIDHGHFQYNCVFLGLVIWSMICISKGRNLLAAFLFTLALNYKQMALYYALPFFWYLFSINIRTRPLWKGLGHIILTGLVVLGTSIIIFIPYISNRRDFLQVIERLFPFNRGIYEDKVANVWFCLSIFFKFKRLYSQDLLVKLSLIATLVTSLAPGLHLLFKPNLRNFKYSLINISLSFFLLSFQVHEKTILLPALTILLSCIEHPRASVWFSVISTFSLHPLLIKDGQNMTYFCIMIMMMPFYRYIFGRREKTQKPSFKENITRLLFDCFALCILAVSFAGTFLDPPARYPDAYAVFNALLSCTNFVSFFIYYNYIQLFGYKTISSEKKIQ